MPTSGAAGPLSDEAGTPWPPRLTEHFEPKVAIVGRGTAGILSAPLMGCQCVAIASPMHGGSNILQWYVDQNFDVTVRPCAKPEGAKKTRGSKRVNTGEIDLDDFRYVAVRERKYFLQADDGRRTLWKHTPPTRRMSLNGLPGAPELALLLCVRDPIAWFHGMAREHYGSLKSDRMKQDEQGFWLLQRVSFGYDKNVIVLSPEDAYKGGRLAFENALELYALHVYGYLQGRFKVNESVTKVFIIRNEDVLEDPLGVVEELERLGLKRGSAEFRVRESNADNNPSRTLSVIKKDAAKHLAFPDGGVSQLLREKLRKYGLLWNHLGYAHVTDYDRVLQ